MKIFSMFSGIGGFETGMIKVDSSLEFIGHSEIDKYADMVYKYHYPDCKNYGDATKINTKDLSDIDCIVGGFPCQSFSIAGNRGGIEYDTRGTLFQEIIRISKDKKPGIIFLENVRGLLSSNKGWDFYVILDSLAQCGYIVEWQIFNTKNFLPQNRERVFIIGYFGKESGQKIFPIWKNDKQNIKSRQIRRYNNKREKINIKSDINKDRCCNTKIKIADYRNDEGLRIRKDGLCNALPAQARNDYRNGKSLLIENNTIRKLTPIEYERFQGFSDNWTKYGLNENNKKIKISDAQRYKQCGNSVSIPVISFIWKRIMEIDL